MGFRAELANVKAITQKKRDGQMTRPCLKFWIKMSRMVMMIGLHMMKKETMSRKRVRKSRKSCCDTRIWWVSEYARLMVSLFRDAFVICRECKQNKATDYCLQRGALCCVPGSGNLPPYTWRGPTFGTLCGRSRLLRAWWTVHTWNVLEKEVSWAEK